MPSAQQGDTVRVHYTGRLEDGTVFDTSNGRKPLQFVLGTGAVIRGFEDAVEGLSVGEGVTTVVEPENGYGLRSEELVLKVPRQNFPDGMAPQIGEQFEMQSPDGQRTPVTVTKVEAEVVEIDANHPLAGRSLEFELELVGID